MNKMLFLDLLLSVTRKTGAGDRNLKMSVGK